MYARKESRDPFRLLSAGCVISAGSRPVIVCCTADRSVGAILPTVAFERNRCLLSSCGQSRRLILCPEARGVLGEFGEECWCLSR